MNGSQPSLLSRPDTLFGVCEGLGEDFGFNAQLLRVALAVMLLFWSPVGAVAAYVAAGMIVLLSRWLYPDPAPASATEASAARQPSVDEAEAQPVGLAAAA